MTHYKQDKDEQPISIHVFEVYSTHVYYTSMSEDWTETSKLVQQNRSFNRFNISLGHVRPSQCASRTGGTRNSIWKSLDTNNFTSHRVGRRFHKHWRDLLGRTVFTMSWSPLIRIHFFSFSQLNSIAAPSVDISEKSTKQRKLKLGYSFSFPPTFLLPLPASCSARFENFKISCFWEAAGKTRLAQGGR